MEADSTRDRLLEAAQEVFAERGFAAASVREICAKAGVNIAAVNYYFRDKERLYIEAVKAAHCCAMAEPPMPDWTPDTSAFEKLRGFIRVMTERMLRESKPHTTQLMMRELSQPTAACAETVRDSIRPVADVLMSIMRELLPNVSDEECYLFGFSVMGQILIYKQSRPVVRGLIGSEADDQLSAAQIAEHVYRVMQPAIAARRQGGRA
jgi:AcrR family transcriptional regulator